MKANGRDYAAVAARAAGPLAIAFLCGPDEAGASAAAAKLIAALPDAGERVELAGAELRADPVRLGDEARSNSLFGGSRHILATVSGDEAHDAVAILCELIDSGQARGAAPVLIVAQSATDKSRTAKLLIPRKDALAAMFYPPDLRDLAAEVRRMGGAAGVHLSDALSERIARGSGMDLRVARSEVEKLALFLDGDVLSPKSATAEALDAIGAATEEDGFMPIVNAVLSGETALLTGELQRLQDLALNPVGVLLAFERRVAQLAQLAAKLGGGTRVGDLLEAEQRARRVFFRDRPDLEKQLQRWDAGRLERLVDRLAALHRALLANSPAAELLLVQELTQITRFAAHRR